MSAPKRKFKLQFSGKAVMMDSKAAQTMWHSLKAAIQEIHAENASALSFEELYRFAYQLVLHKHGEMLYNGVSNTLSDHLSTVASHVAEAHDARLLHVLQEQWQKQKVTLKMIHDILMYMDRVYVTQEKKMSIYDVGVTIFRDKAIRHNNVRLRMRGILLNSIDRERKGEIIDTELIRATLTMLRDVGITGTAVYETDFEREFISTTRTFYTEEALEFLTRSTCPDYLLKAEKRIQEERRRVRAYLDSSTGPKLRNVIETLLIADKAEALVNMEGSGAVAMLQGDRFEDLHRMYKLFSLVPHTVLMLRNAMRDLVRDDGKALVMDQEGAKVPVEFVQRLLDMRDKFTEIIDRSFRGDKDFHRTLREAFEHFMNLDARCAQFLSMYVDDMMRHGFKGRTEEDIDTILSKVVIIFRYLRDKDLFENFYKNHLQKRLLGNRSLSNDAERNMITKLKTECGFQFTSKLEGMFNDLAISRDFMEQYRRDSRVMAPAGSMELDATVLTTGFWPSQAIAPCSLPAEIAPVCERFTSYYLDKHTGRRLTWQTNQGSADVRTLYTSKRHELVVSTYQMCILMQFNAMDELPFRTLLDNTKIPLDELKRHLLSLTTPRHRVILKLKKGKEIADVDRFRLNPDFTSKMIRVKVPLVSMRSAVAEGAKASAIPETVEEDRRHAIEAAVVRVMKARKTLDHQNLVVEVTKQLSSRFRPSPQAIKKRIESLIEREYLERNEEDRRVYHYLA